MSFSKNHLERICKSVAVGNEFDFNTEIENMPKVTWVVSQEFKDNIESIGSILDYNGEHLWLFESMRIKLVVGEDIKNYTK